MAILNLKEVKRNQSKVDSVSKDNHSLFQVHRIGFVECNQDGYMHFGLNRSHWAFPFLLQDNCNLNTFLVHELKPTFADCCQKRHVPLS